MCTARLLTVSVVSVWGVCLPVGGVCLPGRVCLPGGGGGGGGCLPVGDGIVGRQTNPVDRMTDVSENITLPHTWYAGGKKEGK